MMKVREAILGIKPYVPGKPIEEVKRELGLSDVIKLASNENPLGPSPRGVEAAGKALESLNLYPDGACFELKEALSAHLGVSSDELIVGNGSDEVIKLLAETFLHPEDEVIIGQYTFSEYEFATRLMGGKLVVIDALDWHENLAAMAEAITDKTRLIFVGNPNNPLGTIAKKEAVDSLLAKLPQDAILVLDEAYYEYATDPDYPQSVDYVKAGKNVVVLRTFSKAYGLAGLRVGYGIAKKEIIDLISRAREPFNVNSLAQTAAVAALGDEEHLGASQRVNEEGKSYLYAQFDRLGLSYIPTEANFIMVQVGRSSREVFQALLQKGVIIRTGNIFGLDNFIRVSIGLPEENQRFIAALEEVLA
jgi:histidinol-phosphate aminotransferase